MTDKELDELILSRWIVDAPLVNPHEIATDAALEEAAERGGLRIQPKVQSNT